ncbi:hypothetical protein DICPUDRAFT_91219 [Dictyostelium purpureum]|uniref:Uncharacterized protein n=1 Tax=Dictyostelium purpureum TaxID=5786 RepID=F0Z970_DICPU|nr:uncharacterized protein DICPUDRAFT_91219 [Dictyostelium purpureum]EGC39529.1 hypothetical protein DICPUDRAFT_91219 [Dictyostelium purpureum]|eukprot:XP_003283976.1 hypothetical protein DICPUDRAFT_91219 [Dictyostelium purpureum]
MPLVNNNSNSNNNNNNKQIYIYGTEFRVAYNYAKENKCTIVLGDRDSRVTWKRVANYLDLGTIFNVSMQTIKSYFQLYNKSAKEIREIYYKEASKTINEPWDSVEWRNSLPLPAKKGLIDERDQYMASCIRDAPGKKIVAVVGKGHVKGISRHINSDMEGFYVRRDLEDHMEPNFIAKYSYPIILTSLFLTPATLGTFAISKLKKKPLSKPQFFLGVVGLASLELISTNYLVNNFLKKLDTLKDI